MGMPWNLLNVKSFSQRMLDWLLCHCSHLLSCFSSWGQWKDIISSGRFKTKVSERDVEAISRTILVYCLHHYKGDEKVKCFIRDLVKASITRERLPSEERDATYTPLPLTGKTKTRNKKGKSSNKNKSAIALLEVGNEWRTCDPETIILDEGYKKHLQHHCNK